MKKGKLCFYLVATALAIAKPTAAKTPPPIVAIFDVEDKGAGLSRELRDRLGDYLAMSVAATGAYQVVPRDQLKMRLVTQKRRSYKNCYDQTCQIEIGKEMAAQKSLSTIVMKLGSRCMVTAVLFDLRKATSEGGASTEGGCSEDAIVDSIKTLVSKLVVEKAGRAEKETRSNRQPKPQGSSDFPRNSDPLEAEKLVEKSKIVKLDESNEPPAETGSDSDEVGFSGYSLVGLCYKDGFGGGAFYYCDEGNVYGWHSSFVNIFFTFTEGSAHGFQMGAINYVKDSMKGLQWGALVNYIGGNLKGASSAAVIRVKGKSTGILMGLANYTGVVTGLDAGWIFSYTPSLTGIQLGLVNHAGEVKGAQIGVIYNYARTLNGVQIGIINVTQKLVGIQIGLINVAIQNKVPFMPIVLIGW